MNLILKRKSAEEAGIFGCLSSLDGSAIVAQTLEHAFPIPDQPGQYAPVIPPGTYTCVRGMHQLAHMSAPFETFEITGVQHHSKLLFHTGNLNEDSEGCVLLGQSLGQLDGAKAVLESHDAFKNFMQLQTGLSTFPLVVE